jgi:hypothetical protein
VSEGAQQADQGPAEPPAYKPPSTQVDLDAIVQARVARAVVK